MSGDKSNIDNTSTDNQLIFNKDVSTLSKSGSDGIDIGGGGGTSSGHVDVVPTIDLSDYWTSSTILIIVSISVNVSIQITSGSNPSGFDVYFSLSSSGSDRNNYDFHQKMYDGNTTNFSGIIWSGTSIPTRLDLTRDVYFTLGSWNITCRATMTCNAITTITSGFAVV